MLWVGHEERFAPIGSMSRVCRTRRHELSGTEVDEDQRMNPERDHERRRLEMVDRQIAARGVRSPSVLAAMRQVRRETYVPPQLLEYAYEDSPLAIGEQQTISQPYIVAFMIEALELRPRERVLEIGTGSGYAAAVMDEIGAEVFTIERHEHLLATAAANFFADGRARVHARQGDGTLGWPEEAPFDAILVSACGPRVPASLRDELVIGGRLVIPVGTLGGSQRLKRIRRFSETEFGEEDLGEVRFVPLIGAQGWQPEPPPEQPFDGPPAP
jgi:protein-L-isoaspartate(D-aspartate) O-methyltransferase